MSTTSTPNLGLQIPGPGDQGWAVPLTTSLTSLDGFAPLSNLVVTTNEAPSATLSVRVAAGSFVQLAGTIANFAAQTGVLVPANVVTCLWLTDAGVLTQGTAFPATCVPLATVTAATTVILAIADARVVNGTTGGTAALLPQPLATSSSPTFAALTIAGPIRSQGSYARVVTVTTNYTTTATDEVIRADASAGPITITLPAASTVGGQQVHIKKIDSSGNAVTIASISLIDGSTSQSIVSQYVSRSLVADAASNTWGFF